MVQVTLMVTSAWRTISIKIDRHAWTPLCKAQKKSTMVVVLCVLCDCVYSYVVIYFTIRYHYHADLELVKATMVFAYLAAPVAQAPHLRNRHGMHHCMHHSETLIRQRKASRRVRH